MVLLAVVDKMADMAVDQVVVIPPGLVAPIMAQAEDTRAVLPVMAEALLIPAQTKIMNPE